MEAYKSLLEMGLWVIVATMGWFLRELWGAVKELRSDLHRLEVNLPTNYIRRDEFAEGVRQIREDFQLVFQRLDDMRSGR